MKKQKNSILKQYWINRNLVFMMLPGLLLLLVFAYGPMYGIIIAFKDFKMAEGVMASPWVGLQHFRTLFSGQDFPKVFRNTLVISLLKLGLGFPAPILFALLLNEMMNVKFKKVVQTFSYLPHFFSWVILGGIVTMVFSNRGPVNTALSWLGMEKPIEFFANNTWFIAVVVLSHIWQTIGWGSIIYISSLSGVDAALYEAAYVDGAGRFKQVIHISIPCLVPTIVTMFILNLGSVLNAGFDQIYNLYNPTVYEVADILDTYVLRKMQSMDYSLGTAVGLFKSLIALILVVLTNQIANRLSDGEQGIW